MRTPFAAVAALLFLCVQSGIAQRGQITLTHATQALKHPGTNDSVAATLAEGTTLRICEVRGEWLKALSTAKKALWVHKDATDVWPEDRAVVEKTAQLFDRPGRYDARLREGMAPTGSVNAGTSVRIETAQGGWDLIILGDGTEGWVHQMNITRSLLAPATAQMNAYLSRDSAAILKTMTNISLTEGDPCIILGHGTNYSRVRTSTGDEGWVFAHFAEYEDATPAGHNLPWFFHFMRSIDRWGSNGWAWLATFALWWFVLPFTYALLFAYLGLIAFGRIRIIPNLLLKIAIALTVFAGLLILTNIPGEVYPYSETTLGTLWSLLVMCIPPVALTGVIDRMRCPRCKSMAEHPVVGVDYAGTEIRGTVSASGHVNATATDRHVITRECQSCKCRWQTGD